ncbi:NAD-dependent dehydratase [Tamlana sedimentorum]|uniref:NAD-dependent dehydratase n=1 Tax=Neotamlana sedimentorum TaxID=1435349 RepID=A0A0D7WAR0_9FLAO|nr:SDR family oxidoreductase [Tamlana sedimentorum]KJD36179.1 NAD-dependent dehydratase [Tamlana sedimentorum]
MENILIAGANGTTGKQIVNLINKSDHYKPIAMVRKQEQVAYFKDKGIETVVADLEQDVTNAFTKHIDKVLFAAGSGGKNVIGVDQEGAKKLIDAAQTNNVSKFVMLSSMGADNPEIHSQIQEYLKAKHNADEHLKASDLNYVIVRPGSLKNDDAVGKIELKNHFERHGEITRADVAQTLVQCLDDDVPNNITFEILEGSTPIKRAVFSLALTEVEV